MNTLFFSATLLGLTGLPIAGHAQTRIPPAPPTSSAPADPGVGGEPAPVAPAPHALTTRSGRVRSVVTGPDGTMQSLLLRDGSTVMIPPGSNQALRVKEGTLVHVTGQDSLRGGANQIAAQSIRVGRQTFVFGAATPVGAPMIAGGAPVPLPPAGAVPSSPPPPGGPVPPPPPAAGAAPPPPPPTPPGVPAPPSPYSKMRKPQPSATGAAPQPDTSAPPPPPVTTQGQPITPTPQP